MFIILNAKNNSFVLQKLEFMNIINAIYLITLKIFKSLWIWSKGTHKKFTVLCYQEKKIDSELFRTILQRHCIENWI